MISNTDSSVKVVVRIRPQMASEKIDMCEVCTRVLPDLDQISLGEGRSFTFDSVCDLDSSQVKVYELCALDLINGLFEGYNATLIAYGQTGSGKTYTMGTCFDLSIEPSSVGIVPRAMDQLFGTIDERKRMNEEIGLPRPEFSVSAQFMELYNEEIFDLLSPSNDKTKKSGIKIHEDGNSNICVVGLNSYKISSKEDAIECLKVGTLSRSTASTNMNVQSSRSHAIFSIFLQQKRYTRIKKVKDTDNNENDDGDDVRINGGKEDEGHEDDEEVVVELLNAKFNFVDLAGSERLKRTGATGDRAKEGISINCGLLALGNVISALGDLAKIGCHVPYRDSKLTRILQDSLGGNSHTTMIACISPSDRDFMETLNTLKYANRARNIRNKVTVNKDMSRDQMIQSLRTEVASLRKQLQAIKGGTFEDLAHNDLIAENRMLLSENRDLHGKVKAMSLTIDDVTARNVRLQLERDTAVMMREAGTVAGDVNGNEEKMQNLLKNYVEEAETYRSKLAMAERHLANLSSVTPTTYRSNDTMSRSMTCYPSSDQSLAFLNRSDDVIKQAQQDLENLNKLKQVRERSMRDRSRSERKSEVETTESSGGNGCYDDVTTTGDEDEEDDDDSLGEGSETEIENVEDLEGNLAELSCEISIKQKLIDELIESQKRVRLLKQQYEEKITNLEEKIKVTEQERDQVFQGIGSDKKGSKEDTKRLKKEYEDKLSDMKEKLLKLNAAKKEHKKLMVNQGNYERRLNTLQSEMTELKRIKVKLMRQLEEEAHRRQQYEQKMRREMASLQKIQRTKDVQLKNLEVERRKKDAVLKRKIQEVEALKKKEKFLLDKRLAAKKMKAHRDKKALPWDKIEKLIETSINKKQALRHLDKDMEKWMKQREHLCRKLDHLTERLKQAESKKEEDVSCLMDEIDRIRKNMNSTQDSIHMCQKCIMTFEESKDDDLESLISNCSMGDVLYFLERCTTLVINKGLMVAQKEEECKELQAQLDQERTENQLNMEAVERLIGDKVEMEVKHGVIVSGEDYSSDRSPTPPLLLIDSLEDLEEYPYGSNLTEACTNITGVKRSSSTGRQSDVREDKEADDTFQLDNGVGSMLGADSNFSTPSPKLHLVHCMTATGHTKSVLSLHATRNRLFSSGKDASVKVWDLERCSVVTSYDDNPGSVVKVRHLESLGLIFAASTYIVKVWDPRSKGCVAVLTSSGSTMDQSQLTSGSLVSCPPGETNINNIASNQSGSLFLSAAGNSVRIWDTKMFKPISRLHGGHQSSITAMSLVDINQAAVLVATGSKDNSIRVYNLGSKELSSGSSINPKLCLSSCHSDNIESLCFNGPNHLYSGARDMTISKWDLSGGGQHRQTIQNAHRGWVSSLALSECNLQIGSSSPSSSSSSSPSSGWLLSGCQSGTVRLWSSANMTLLSEYRSAHQGAINCLVVGGSSEGMLGQQRKSQQQFVFTASNDKTINIWRAKNGEDK